MNTTDRTVIVELFSGAGCPPCVNVDLGLKDFIDDHTRSEAVALVYHRSIPADDKLETSETVARHRYYIPKDHGSSTPNYWVDGRIVKVGGFASRFLGEQWFEAKYDGERETANRSHVSMTVDGIISSTKTGTVWMNVTALMNTVEADLALHTVIVRKTYGPWNGGNGVRMHHWVVRKMLPDTGGEPFNISMGQTRSFSYEFNLSADNFTDWNDMAIVSFVQSNVRIPVDSEGAPRPRYIAPILQSGYGDLRVVFNASDRDGDGVLNDQDAFPDDRAASVDTDGDGYPDEWNRGYWEESSTTGLRLDNYPEDPRMWRKKGEPSPVGVIGAIVAIGIIAGMMRRRNRW